MLETKYEDGTPVPNEVIFQLIMFMTWAGHETTTAQTTWALTDLMLNPDWFAKVRDEVDQVIGDTPVQEITWAQLGQLKTIDMAIRESERLHPIATMLQRVANEDIYVGGYRIPKETAWPWCRACRISMSASFPIPRRSGPSGSTPTASARPIWTA